MPAIELSNEDKATCHKVALASIEHGLSHFASLPIDEDDYPDSLQINAATFVTLERQGNLRGCIGTLEAYQPLIKDISEHAYSAAFQDPRFPALAEPELNGLDIKISVLTPAEQMSFRDQNDLVQQIRPCVDGLILEYGHHRGTFLPSVWEQLPEVEDFLHHLKLKAGLPGEWWDDSVKISRYETISF